MSTSRFNTAHTVFVCFLFISEQKATCATYSIKLTGFYNRDEKCLQRGTDWVFKYSGLHLGFKGLTRNRLLLTITLAETLHMFFCTQMQI